MLFCCREGTFFETEKPEMEVRNQEELLQIREKVFLTIFSVISPYYYKWKLMPSSKMNFHPLLDILNKDVTLYVYYLLLSELNSKAL